MSKNPQLEMMRQALKAAGMNDEQIEQALAAQEAAMNAFSGISESDLEEAGKEMTDALSGMDMDSYFELAKNPSIDKNDQWAVACGADLAHLRADILNDLSSGDDEPEHYKNMLARDWGIKDKKAFNEMAESLLNGRHSKAYNALAKGGEAGNFEEEAENVKEALETFERDGLIKKGKTPDMSAWDLARLINISRFAYDAKILSSEEALNYIRKAAMEMKKIYKSWKELSIGYQLGRYVWGGGSGYEEMKEGMEQLLTAKDSPWVMLPFDMEVSFSN